MDTIDKVRPLKVAVIAIGGLGSELTGAPAHVVAIAKRIVKLPGVHPDSKVISVSYAAFGCPLVPLPLGLEWVRAMVEAGYLIILIGHSFGGGASFWIVNNGIPVVLVAALDGVCNTDRFGELGQFSVDAQYCTQAFNLLQAHPDLLPKGNPIEEVGKAGDQIRFWNVKVADPAPEGFGRPDLDHLTLPAAPEVADYVVAQAARVLGVAA